MDENFESAGDARLWKSRPFPGESDEGDDMVDGGVVKEEVFA